MPSIASKLSNSMREERMNTLLAKHESIESLDDMSDEYYDHLTNLMLQQADSELAGGFGYVPWIMKAPTTEEMLVVSNIVRDEVRHARAMYRLLEDARFGVDDWVDTMDFTFRVDDTLDLGDKRAASDKRVNIFYYPIDSWADFVMFNFLMDRGAGHQLEDVKTSSYGPWRREIDRIFKEEKTHIAHGDYWVKRLSLDPTTKGEIQEALNHWWPRVMAIFGRPGSKKNKRYRDLGLKSRDNNDVRKTFEQEVRDNAEAWGLVVPQWIPDWQKVPEDSVIPG
ncbi:MAG: phenylacetate-CoA oxygenase subunit PaaI [Ignavibacteriae bacterium]|nr:phenylacetate-CoA oxygenase subunit PaaI [Ignavibacteria bacterium]MBI3363600.1 phenylacetate-CoA oxygenase subunit PaaI [Ignavibacteriota bacterium]